MTYTFICRYDVFLDHLLAFETPTFVLFAIGRYLLLYVCVWGGGASECGLAALMFFMRS